MGKEALGSLFLLLSFSLFPIFLSGFVIGVSEILFLGSLGLGFWGYSALCSVLLKCGWFYQLSDPQTFSPSLPLLRG